MQSLRRRHGGSSVERSWNVVGAVRSELGAGSTAENGVQIDAALCLAIIQVARRQQTMPLGADVTRLPKQVFGKLKLHVQVVLRRVLGSQMGLELPVEKNRPVLRPVHRLLAGRIDDPVKGIGLGRIAKLILKRSIEEAVVDDVAPAKRRLGAELR